MDDKERREKQYQREKYAIENAVAKLRDQVEDNPVNSPAREAFVREAWAEFAKIVSREQKRFLSDHRPRYATLMLGLSADHIAFIVVRCILAVLYEKKKDEDQEPDKFTALAAKIGLHCRLQWVRTEAPERQRAIYDFGGEGKLDATAERARQRAAVILKGDWTEDNDHIRLGAELIALASPKLVSMPRKKDKDGKKSGVITVVPSDLLQRALEWKDDFATLARPFHLPMICLPNPWVGLEGGGYLTNENERSIHLVKHWNNPKILEGLPKGEYVVTRDAVNALQETPWRVNSNIYTVLQQVEVMKDLTVPDGTRELLSLKLATCADLEKEKGRFYFPYQLDFRGRAYCLPPLVNPQADDVGRSLLEFADGKHLGAEGAKWLAIHLANSFGECKGTLDERVAWTEKRSRKICDSAADPFGKQWWMKADKPWRFLAASFEWKGHLSDNDGFLSFLPITVDGSCNGFQHLSGLLLNTKGASATNLAPTSIPGDFYGEVATLLYAVLQKEKKKGKAEAKDWLENAVIDRKLVKPAVMATPYGIGRAKIEELLLNDRGTKKLKNREKSCAFLAARIKSCIGKAFPEARQLSKWLQKLTVAFAKETNTHHPRGVHWTAPSGFRVVHEEWLGKEKRLKTSCGTLVLYDSSKPAKLSTNDQVKGIVANFVHSLDAAHLMLTIRRLNQFDEGNGKLIHFSVIHDGFAVHACDVPCLRKALQQEFIGIYEKPVLQSFFLEQQLDARATELPAPPQTGDFVIHQVGRSDYFFS